MRWKAVIDRIENDHAVVLFHGGERKVEDEVKVDLPLSLLPPHAAEGDHLTVDFQIDKGATEAARKRVDSLLKEIVRRPNRQ